MGMSDRDYMRERRPKEQMWERSPQVSKLRSNLWMLLTWVSVLFLLYKSFLWWELTKKPIKAINSSIEVAVPEAAPVVSKQSPTPQSRQLSSVNRSAQDHSGDRTVTKCMVNSKVLYTDSDCPTGSKESSVTVHTANVGTVAPQMPVTASLPVGYQTVVTNVSSSSSVSTAPTRNIECGYLDEQIKVIDSLARQPQSGQTQDHLSAQRKKFRSRQFELHC